MRKELVIVAVLAVAAGGWFLLSGDQLVGAFAALFALVAVVMLVRAAGAKDAAAPVGQPAAAPTMALHEGRWIKWDGTRWVDAETGAPV